MNSKNVAVIGVSSSPVKAGSPILKSILDFGFEGNVYPVNPNLGSLMGLPVYAGIKDIEGQVDLAVISTAPKTVPGVLKECVEKKIKAVIINTEGFAEAGEEGKRLQQDIASIMQPALDFLNTLDIGDPFLILALMTDKDVIKLARTPVKDARTFNSTTVSEIAPFLEQIGKVDLCDPDLDW